MRVRLVFMLMLLTCAPPPSSSTPSFDFDLLLQRALVDQISAFQVALVTRGSSLDCVAVQRTCLNTQVDASRVVLLKDQAGKSVHGVVFPLNVTAGTQDVSLHDLPIGKDYAVVVEALSKDPTPNLVGSSCNFVKEIAAGSNPTVFATIVATDAGVKCDPRLDK